MFPSPLAVGNLQVLLPIKSDNFLERFIGTIDVLIFDVQDRIDSVRLQERPKPILKSKAGKHTALMLRMLPIEVEFCRPPSPHSVFEFIQGAQERVEIVRPP